MFLFFIPQAVLYALFILITFTACLLIYTHYQDKNLPPGPPRLPLIGNLHQAPSSHAWRQYHTWNQQYGPIFSLKYGPLDTLIVIGSHSIAKDLFEKRSAIYSSRPRLVMAGELLTKGLHMLLRPYNAAYKLHQRMEAPVVNKRASECYKAVQDLESKQMMRDFLGNATAEYRNVFERFTASILYGLAYGYRLDTGKEQILKDVHEIEDGIAIALQVGYWIVDMLPFLNYLPRIFTPWKKFSDHLFALESSLHLRNMDLGLSTSSWNWTKHISASKEASSMPKLEIAYDIGVLADAGLDSTTVTLECFALAMLNNPEVQEKARMVLDEVVGEERLPRFGDRKNLVYIDAIISEILRWRPVAPAGVPHLCSQADIYAGYRIPKNAIMIWNAWSLNMDPIAFPHPTAFLPERWIGPHNTLREDLPSSSFGYGKRSCVGRHIARNSLWVAIARLLWGYEIIHELDGQGRKIEVDDMDMTDGLTSKPVKFPCRFVVRSEKREEVIRREWETADKDIDRLLDEIAKERRVS